MKFPPKVYLLIISMLAGMSLLVAACGSTTAAINSQIIGSRYQSAKFLDATFSVALHQTGGTSGAIDATGTGRLTKDPYRFYANLQTQVSGLSVGIQQISTDDYDYQKTSMDGKWTKTTPQASTSAISLKDLAAAKLLGIENLGGTTVYHLSESKQNSVGTDTGDIWLRTSDYLPVKFTTTTFEDKDNNTVSTTLTLIFTTWNTGVQVALPADSEVSTS